MRTSAPRLSPAAASRFSRHAHGVAEGAENHPGRLAISMQASMRPIGRTHTGQPGRE
jgi:hypothetical protein